MAWMCWAAPSGWTMLRLARAAAEEEEEAGGALEAAGAAEAAAGAALEAEEEEEAGAALEAEAGAEEEEAAEAALSARRECASLLAQRWPLTRELREKRRAELANSNECIKNRRKKLQTSCAV